MVSYLSKSDASEGFNQIINFLNGSSIKYALTVNPNIYVSCIKQFWTIVAVKKVNDIMRLHALVDKKKVVITEVTIRDALRLDDAEGVECLPNEEIFAELARMGYEKPSTKLTFYKAFSQASGIGDLSSHTTKYTSPALTQKVFANMRRVGKGFSRLETPLFEGMIVEQQVAESDDDEVHDGGVPAAGNAAEGDVSAANDEVPTADEEPCIPSPTPLTPPPQPSQDIPSTSQRRMIAEMDQDADVILEENKDVADDNVKDDQDADVEASAHDQGRKAKSQAEIYKINLEHTNKVLSMQEDESKPAEVQEVVDVVTTAKIITEVVTAASETITVASINITTAKAQVPTATLIAAPSRLIVAPRRMTKGVVIKDLEESTTSTIIPAETKSKDKGKGILVEEQKEKMSRNKGP
nr:xylulose kinase-1 [Tanacetum cinerariifolium]